MDVFDHVEFDHHEQVVFCHDPNGLRAIIAVHSTALGPAAGGCRVWDYPSDEAALTDVLRLSRAMSYKNALAGLRLGGGKSVVIASPHSERKHELLAAFAEHVQRLAGRYWTAEDVGVGLPEVELLATKTNFVFGRPGMAGDPSPATARGVFAGIKAAVRHKLDSDIGSVRVAIQGVGNVGLNLARLLTEAGAKVVVADVIADKVNRAVAMVGAEIASTDDIHRQDAEVFAPCALGGSLNPSTIAELRAVIVAGSANNQLASGADGAALHRREILYAPDYVVNAGGMMWASADIFGKSWDPEVANAHIDGIESVCHEIFKTSAEEDVPTSEVADRMARAVLDRG